MYLSDIDFKVLFICKENSIRSIMAEAILNKLSDGKIKAVSAGLNGNHDIHPLTKKILMQEGFSVNQLHSKKLEPELLAQTDFVVTVCDVSSCVMLNNLDPKTTLFKWDIAEPHTGRENDFSTTFKVIQNRCLEFLSILPV
ncbi:MAG: low molecular weight phosphatase family protein [Planctomycetota bacterium]